MYKKKIFTYSLVYVYFCMIYKNKSNLYTVRLRYVSLRQCNQAGCLRWGSFWAPPLLVLWTACEQLWTSPLVTPLPVLSGTYGVSGARRTAPRPPPLEAPQPGRRPRCSFQSNHVGDLSSGARGHGSGYQRQIRCLRGRVHIKEKDAFWDGAGKDQGLGAP